MKVITISGNLKQDLTIKDGVGALVILSDKGDPLLVWAQLGAEQYVSQNASETGFDGTLAMLGFKKEDFKH
ncbi:MAG: hypothetical protein D0530_04970 [Methylococcales bacterium]|nr:MAG: hypothetical protein D0530_04970 [Methylococcales bacterium]